MSLNDLSPRAIKFGLAVPFVIIAAIVVMAVEHIPPPPKQAVDLAITTSFVILTAVLLIRRLNRRSRQLWGVAAGFTSLHLFSWCLLWTRTANLAGLYLYIALIAEIYLLGWLLTYVATKSGNGSRRSHHGVGKQGTD